MEKEFAKAMPKLGFGLMRLPRINKVTDAGIDVGSAVKVKFMGLDKKGRMDFSIRDAE